jgi:thiol:disulfide interchange protein DsbD
VTKNSETDQILLKHFNLVGPPAILFFAPNQGEKTQYRIIGYQDSSHFLQHLQKLTRY